MMKRFEIWQAAVKFEDSDEVKNRPVMIWNDTAFIMAYKMTGTNRGNEKDEFQVIHWKEAGLSKETSIRIEKVLHLEKKHMLYKIGELDPRDQLRFSLRIAQK